MLNNTVEKIEKTLTSSKSLSDKQKSDLIKLVGDLKKELALVYDKEKDDTESVINFAAVSAHEAAKKNINSELADISRKGLFESARKFEVSHPKIFETVNAVCDYLAKLGI